MTTGRCLCGAVRYAVAGPLGPVDHCHCSICRRAHGAPCSSFGRVALGDLRITAGADRVTDFASSEGVERSFCATCGTRLFFRHAAMPDFAWVTVGSLDDDAGITPSSHMFVGSKAPWFTIGDGLPQHAEYPPFEGE